MNLKVKKAFELAKSLNGENLILGKNHISATFPEHEHENVIAKFKLIGWECNEVDSPFLHFNLIGSQMPWEAPGYIVYRDGFKGFKTIILFSSIMSAIIIMFGIFDAWQLKRLNPSFLYVAAGVWVLIPAICALFVNYFQLTKDRINYLNISTGFKWVTIRLSEINQFKITTKYPPKAGPQDFLECFDFSNKKLCSIKVLDANVIKKHFLKCKIKDISEKTIPPWRK